METPGRRPFERCILRKDPKGAIQQGDAHLGALVEHANSGQPKHGLAFRVLVTRRDRVRSGSIQQLIDLSKTPLGVESFGESGMSRRGEATVDGRRSGEESLVQAVRDGVVVGETGKRCQSQPGRRLRSVLSVQGCPFRSNGLSLIRLDSSRHLADDRARALGLGALKESGRKRRTHHCAEHGLQ